MTAKTRKKSTTPKPLTNQEQFDDLRDRITELGTTFWELECQVNVYQGEHLQVSAGGYVKYEFRGCDTPAKILKGMRSTLNGLTKAVTVRLEELHDALEANNTHGV